MDDVGDTPGISSKEATAEQLQLAREEGNAYAKALEAMYAETGRGNTQAICDYRITCTAEDAEAQYIWENGELTCKNPTIATNRQ